MKINEQTTHEDREPVMDVDAMKRIADSGAGDPAMGDLMMQIVENIQAAYDVRRQYQRLREQAERDGDTHTLAAIRGTLGPWGD